LVQQIVDELSRVGRLGEVQDQQGQCDGEDAVDERVKSSWSQSWSPTSSDGRSCATSTQVTTCDERHEPVLAASVPVGGGRWAMAQRDGRRRRGMTGRWAAVLRAQ